MRNPIEEGTQRPTEQEEIGESHREIFNTAINILKAKGQQSAKNLWNEYQTYQVFVHAVDYPRQEAITVKIWAGANLAKARKVSVHALGVGRLEVRKTGVKGQEKYKGKEFSEYPSHSSEDLNGRRSFHILAVRGYLKDIRRVRNEIIPQSH